MKRESLITKLVAFMLCVMMVVGCLPVSAFAAENDWEGDIDVVETEPPLGSESYPIDLTNEWAWNEAHTEATVTVTVPAGNTIYYQSYGVAGMTMTIGDGDPIVCSGNPRTPYVWSIPNNGETEADYVITIAYPVGSMENPYAASLYENVVSVEAGDKDGYYMTYTAEYTGTLVVTISTEAAGWSYVINNMTTYVYGDTQLSDSDPVVNPAEIAVTEGDEIQIIVNTYDPADSWNSPAGEINAYLEYKPGSCEAFPIFLGEQVNNVTNAGTVYYKGYFAGMNVVITGEGEFTVISDGEEIAAVDGKVEVSYPAVMGRPMPNSIVIVGDGEFTIAASYPLGTMENPAVAVLGDNTASIAAGNTQGYYWTYTAEQDGNLIVTISAKTGWTYVINNLTAGTYGDTQWSDSDPVVNPATITVSAGDQIQIMVNTYDAETPWAAPAGDVTVNLAYEPEGPEVDESLVFYRLNASGGDLQLGDDIRATFIVRPASEYDAVYLEVTKDGVTTIVEKGSTSTDTVFRYAYVLPAAHMTMDINVTIWGEKDGVTYRGEELVYSVRRCAEAKLDAWISKPAAAGQCKLLMNMLYYGELAQIQFGINTDNLATTGLPQEYLDLITTTEPSLKAYPTVDETGMTAKLYNMGFMLQEKVKLSVFFKFNTAITNAEEYTIEVKHIPSKEGVAPVTYTYTSDEFTVQNSNKVIKLYFDKIAPSQMRDDVEYTLYHNGEAISATYVRSMETVAEYYVANQPALTNLIYAIMNYADAAKAVFG